jgi:hypothetical protein
VLLTYQWGAAMEEIPRTRPRRNPWLIAASVLAALIIGVPAVFVGG